MDNDNYRMTSLDVDMTDDDGNSLDFFDKIKEMCGDKEMILMAVPRKKTRDLKECFGTPISCANCVSKGQDTRFPEELKRCSACHVLSYCTEDCQREHWLLSHSKICKALCGKKGHGKALHDKENCPNCDTKGHTKCKINNDRNSLEMACVMDWAQVFLLRRLWSMFGYHGLVKGSLQGQTPCRCTSDNKFEEMRDCTYPMEPPFILGELSGKYLGWIDTSLSYLGLLFGAWSRKYEEEINQHDLNDDIKHIKKFIFEMRGGYWYYATIERSREMTDYLFGQWAITQSVKFANEENGHMANVEKAFRAPNKQRLGRKVWWETFIFHLSEFFRKIKDIRYLKLDLQKFPEDELHMLKQSYSDAMWNLSQPASIMLPVKRTDGVIEESFLVQLPEGTKCMVCYENLEGKKAQWYLQYGEVSKVECMLWQTEPNAPVEDLLALRFGFRLPVIFFLNSEGYKVCCSGTTKKHPCLKMMIQLKTEWHQILTRQSFNFGLQSEKCYACLKYSLHCHRCSDCKSVRYCSNGCIQDDWQFHEKNCSPTLKKMEDKKLKKIKKIKTETDKEKIFEVAKLLSKCDTSMRYTIENWVKKYSDKDALLTYILQDSKNIEAPKNKSKKKGKDKEESKVTNEVKSIIINGNYPPTKKASIERVKKMEKLVMVAKERLLGKKFELRHMQSKVGQELNKKLCEVVITDYSKIEITKFTYFESRVNCKIADTGKLFAIKLANLVEPGAEIKDGNVCKFGHKFRFNDRAITAKLVINKHLGEALDWAEEKKLCRPDQLFRIGMLKQMMEVEVDGYTTDRSWNTTIPCMEFPSFVPWEDMDEDEFHAASLAAVRPGCVGETTVNFAKFHQILCGCENQLAERFREVIRTGMCHQCQAYYIEKDFLEEKDQFIIGRAFLAATR